MPEHEYLFYAATPAEAPAAELPAGYEVVYWRPTSLNWLPPQCPALPFGVWALFHHLRIFSNQDYGLLLLFREGRLVHRSCVFPRYLRFPFMGEADLQVGDTWTAEDERGKGLARFALTEILRREPVKSRTFWYIVESANLASIRVVEKSGFGLVSAGRRVPRFGIGLLGFYDYDRDARHVLIGS